MAFLLCLQTWEPMQTCDVLALSLLTLLKQWSQHAKTEHWPPDFLVRQLAPGTLWRMIELRVNFFLSLIMEVLCSVTVQQGVG